MTDVPKGLTGSGAEFWREIMGTYKLRIDERRLLEEACRSMVLIDTLEEATAGADMYSRGSMGQEVINPVFTELRQQRAGLARLLGQLKLPDVDGSAAGKDQSSDAGRALVALRWGN